MPASQCVMEFTGQLAHHTAKIVPFRPQVPPFIGVYRQDHTVLEGTVRCEQGMRPAIPGFLAYSFGGGIFQRSGVS